MSQPPHQDVMREYTPEQAFRILGITQADADAVIQAVPEKGEAGVWERRTQAFHDLIKKQQKALLRKYHPDICKDSDALDKTQEINRVADLFLAMKILPRPKPRPIPQTDQFYSNTGTGTVSTVSNGMHVTIIRIFF